MLIYHHNDIDGRVAAYLAVQKFRNSKIYTKFKEISYPRDFPYDTVEKGELVILVDTSFTSDTVENLFRLVDEYDCNVLWVDHHSSSIDVIKQYSKRFESLFSSNKLYYLVDDRLCGTSLTYILFDIIYKISQSGTVNLFNSEKIFFDTLGKSYWYHRIKNEFYSIVQNLSYAMDNSTTYDSFMNITKYSIPKWLYYTDMWDCFKHNPENEENTYCFQYAMNSYDLNPANSEVLDSLINENIFKLFNKTDRIIETDGKSIYNYMKFRNSEDMKAGKFEAMIDGIKTVCLNSTAGNSLAFGEDYKTYDMVCIFKFSASEGLWKYSLYSRKSDGANCQKIAESYKGGGHEHSAGFKTKECIFGTVIPILKKEK